MYEEILITFIVGTFFALVGMFGVLVKIAYDTGHMKGTVEYLNHRVTGIEEKVDKLVK